MANSAPVDLAKLAVRYSLASKRLSRQTDALRWEVARDLWMAHHIDGVPVKEIATHVGRSTSTVGRWMRAYAQKKRAE